MTDNKLITASITKLTGKTETEWVVYSNKGEELWQLPKRLTELEGMSILHFARKFEKEAFNNGIKFSEKVKVPAKLKAQSNVILQLRSENKNLLAHNEAMFNENERISEKLNKLIFTK